MKTSIIFGIAVFLLILCSAFQGQAQGYVWEPIKSPQGVNTIYNELNLVKFGDQYLFSRIIKGKPKQFVIDDLHGAIPFAWNPDTLNAYSIIYPMKSQQHASLYLAMPALGNQQAMLSIYEFRDGILKSLDALQGLAYSSQPFMAPDGKTLYYVSNRLDGNGGTDIWYFKIQDDLMKGPFSLGGTINTSFNEKNPYLPHPDTLYFSSDMDGGKGGFDILRAIRENAEQEIWSIPEPVEELNSKWNDADFIILNDTAVISRDNPSGEGQSDLYWFKKRPIYQSKPAQLYLSTGNVIQILQNIYSIQNALAFRACIFPSSFESRDVHMISTLGERLTAMPDASIRISKHALTSRILPLLKKKGVKSEQIILDDDSTDSCVMITGNKPALFSPFDNLNIICDPGSIPINVNSIPQGAVKQWTLHVNGKELQKDSIFPANIVYRTIEHIVKPEDSLLIIATAIDKEHNVISDSIEIRIRQTVQNQAGSSITGMMPTLWHYKDQQQCLSYLKEFLSSFENKQNTIELFITEFNSSVAEEMYKVISNHDDFKQWKFLLSSMKPDSALTPLIRLSISHVPGNQKSYMIPILVQ